MQKNDAQMPFSSMLKFHPFGWQRYCRHRSGSHLQRSPFLWNKERAHIRMLQFRQRNLLINFSGISCQAAICAYDSVAGNDDGNLIMSNCTANCLSRFGVNFGSSPEKYSSRHFFVSVRISVSCEMCSSGSVFAKDFDPSNLRPVSQISSAAKRISPSGDLYLHVYTIFLL